MSTRLPQRPAQYFIDEILLQSTANGGWDPAGAQGFDLQAAPGDEGFLPVATSLSDVGATYPTLVVTYSNETSGGETTYDFLTTEGPGQNRDGQLIVTARAEDSEDGYTGDSSTYAAIDADDLVADVLIPEVEDICLRNAQGASTEFSYLGSQRGADIPDDLDVTPPVRQAQCSVAYGWDRRP